MMGRLLSQLAILVAALAACTGAANAQTTNCVGGLLPGTYVDVDVPANATCIVAPGTVTVTGNVTVGSGAVLVANTIGVTFVVNGSLIGVNAAAIEFQPDLTVSILGHVRVTGTTNVIFNHVFIGGTLSIAEATVGNFSFFVALNTVGGSVLVRGITTTSNGGNIVIADNAIGGSLVCVGDTPAPSLRGLPPNTVGGNKVGQCAGL